MNDDKPIDHEAAVTPPHDGDSPDAGEEATGTAGGKSSAEASTSAPSLEEEIASLKDQLQRKQAELINFRNRASRRRAEESEAGRAELVRALLPVVDDLERALETEADNPGAFRDGVGLILRTLQETLRKNGVSRLDPVGEGFDPRVHEAVEHVDSDEAPSGQIIRVYQPGYLMRERLLRPARVVVAKNPAGAAQPEVAAEGTAD